MIADEFAWLLRMRAQEGTPIDSREIEIRVGVEYADGTREPLH